MLNLAKPPRIDHPYFFDRVASNPWQDLRGRARFPQGLLGGQIVGRNECLQIPERLLQDVLGAYQLLLMVKDIMLQRGHGSAGLALDRTSGTPSPTARLRAFFKPEFVPKPGRNKGRVGINSRSRYLDIAAKKGVLSRERRLGTKVRINLGFLDIAASVAEEDGYGSTCQPRTAGHDSLQWP